MNSFARTDPDACVSSRHLLSPAIPRLRETVVVSYPYFTYLHAYSCSAPALPVLLDFFCLLLQVLLNDRSFRAWTVFVLPRARLVAESDSSLSIRCNESRAREYVKANAAWQGDSKSQDGGHGRGGEEVSRRGFKTLSNCLRPPANTNITINESIVTGRKVSSYASRRVKSTYVLAGEFRAQSWTSITPTCGRQGEKICPIISLGRSLAQ